MTETKWSRPAAGREPAAAALLSWLADPDAPRLCLVTGSAGCGKSTLLAWLVGHGTREGTLPERRVHGFVPLAKESARTAAWALAQQLRVAARTPGELATALAADQRRTVLVLPNLHAADTLETVTELASDLVALGHIRIVVEVRGDSPAARRLLAMRPAVMNLDDSRWTDPERYAVWARKRNTGRTPDEEPRPVPPAVDIRDPAAVCAADPWHMTRLYERSHDDHSGLRAAWLRAGASLTREDQSPPDRAVILLAALGDDAEPKLAKALAALTEGAPWRVVWRRVRGDVRPPWPGPARALACAHGHVLVVDHQGTLRVVDETDATAVGRLPEPVQQARAVAATPEGEVLLLDAQGLLRHRRAPFARKATGLAALLDDEPTLLERLAKAAQAEPLGPTTAVAACERLLVLGDATGRVHAVAASGTTTVRLHEGEVTGVTSLYLTAAENAPGIPLVYSGGQDGAVRAWGPGFDPLGSPVRSRSCPVTAVASATTDTGPVLAVAWADGLVEYHALDDDGQVRTYWPGAPVHSLAVTESGRLLVGTDQTLVCLRPV
ncbi:hypothetical protein ACIRU5_05985 [Streptomyces misionensis]|uniref:hypothetical protein n=1 Tax=Streptomyces misionensis TaxID=67331 RepID=UPI00382C9C96